MNNNFIHRLCATLIVVMMNLMAFAEVPQGFNYQSVIRSSSGKPIVNQEVKVTITITDAQGLRVYQETHSEIKTNNYGVFALIVGYGTANSGTFADIDWANGPYNLTSETVLVSDPSEVVSATTTLQSVPYALFALKSGSASGSSSGFSGKYDDLEGAPSLDDFVKSDELNLYVKKTELGEGGNISLEGYAKLTDLDGYVKSDEALVFATKEELANYIKKSEHKDVDLSNYATKEELANYVKVGDITFDGGNVSLEGFATQDYVNVKLKDYAKLSDIPESSNVDLSGYATKESLNDYLKKADHTDVSLDDYATKTYVTDQLKGYAKLSEITGGTIDLEEYAKKEELGVYLRKDDLSLGSYANKDDLANCIKRVDTLNTQSKELSSKINEKVSSETFDELDTKVTDLEGKLNNLSSTTENVATKDELNQVESDLMGQIATSQANLLKALADSLSPVGASYSSLYDKLNAVSTKTDKLVDEVESAEGLIIKVGNLVSLTDDLKTKLGDLSSKVDGLDGVSEKVTELTTATNGIKSSLSEINTQITNLITDSVYQASQITNLSNRVETLEGLVKTSSTDVDALIKELSTEVANVKAIANKADQTATTNATSLTSLTDEVAANKQATDDEITEIKNVLSELTGNTKLTKISLEIQSIKDSVTLLQHDVAKHESDITELKTKVSKNTTDIADLKKNSASNNLSSEEFKANLIVELNEKYASKEWASSIQNNINELWNDGIGGVYSQIDSVRKFAQSVLDTIYSDTYRRQFASSWHTHNVISGNEAGSTTEGPLEGGGNTSQPQGQYLRPIVQSVVKSEINSEIKPNLNKLQKQIDKANVRIDSTNRALKNIKDDVIESIHLSSYYKINEVYNKTEIDALLKSNTGVVNTDELDERYALKTELNSATTKLNTAISSLDTKVTTLQELALSSGTAAEEALTNSETAVSEVSNMKEELSYIKENIKSTDELSSMISELNDKLNNIPQTESIDELKESVEQLEKTVGNMDYDGLLVRVSLLESDNEKLATTNTSLKTQITELTTSVNDLSSSLTKSNKDIASANTTITTLQGKVQTLENDIEELKSNASNNNNTELESRISKLESLVATLATSNSTLSTRNDSLVDAVKKQNTEIATLKTKINSIGTGGGTADLTEIESSISSLAARVESLESKTSSLDFALYDLAIDALDKRITNLEKSDLGNVSNELVAINSKLDDHDSQFATVNSQIKSINSNYTTLDSKVDDIVDDVDDVNASVKNNATSIATLDARITTLEGAEPDFSEINSEIDAINDKLNLLNYASEYYVKYADYEDLNTRVEKLEANGTGTGGSGDVTSADLDDLKSDLIALINKEEQERKAADESFDITDYYEEIGFFINTNSTIKELGRKVTDIEKQIGGLADIDVDEIKEANEATNELYDELKDKLTEIGNLESDMTVAKTSITTLNNSLVYWVTNFSFMFKGEEDSNYIGVIQMLNELREKLNELIPEGGEKIDEQYELPLFEGKYLESSDVFK